MRGAKTFLLLLAMAGLSQSLLVTTATAEDTHSGVAYVRAGDVTVPGYYYKPEGKGPFPAVVMVRAASKPVSDSNPPMPELARAFTSRGYVVLFPCWNIPPELAAERAKDPNAKSRRTTLPEFQGMAQQLAAAVTWTKSQAFIDEDRVVVIGHAVGATLSMLLAEQDIGVRAYVAFSPACATWNERPDLQKAFVSSVRESKAPIFLIQAQNDYTLAPSELLGVELSRRHDLSFVKVYPPFGSSREQGNNFAVAGAKVWGDDVFKFLQRALN